jgi:hypothetical protein
MIKQPCIASEMIRYFFNAVNTHLLPVVDGSRPVELLEDGREGLEAANEWPRSWMTLLTGRFFLECYAVITATVFAIPAVQHQSGTYIHTYTRTYVHTYIRVVRKLKVQGLKKCEQPID